MEKFLVKYWQPRTIPLFPNSELIFNESDFSKRIYASENCVGIEVNP